MKFTLPLIFLLTVSLSSARTFRSADGKNSFEGDFVRLNAKKGVVTISKKRGGQMTTSVEHFSKRDQEYFIKAQKIEDKKKSLRVNVVEGKDELIERMEGIYKFKSEKTPFTFKVSNSSDSSFEDLNLKYWIVVRRDVGDSKDAELIIGNETLSKIDGRGKLEISGPNVLLTKGCTTDDSCPKCQAHAASFGRDKLVGTRVEITDRDGQFLYAKSSNSLVDKAILSNASN